MDIKVSIIVPVYNVCLYIERVLKSILNQTYRSIECILINDCTPDDSMKKVSDFLNNNQCDIDFRIINHEKNRGLSAARNTGIKFSTGDYLYFLDSDDDISLDCISLLVSSLKSNYDVVVGAYEVNAKFPIYCFDNKLYESNSAIVEALYNNEWYVMAWNKLVNKSFIIQYNLFFEEGLLHEDVLWSFQLATFAKSLFLCDSITYKYVIRDNTISTDTNQKKHLVHYFNVINKMISFVSDNNVSNPYNYFILESYRYSYFSVAMTVLTDLELWTYYKHIVNRVPLSNRFVYLCKASNRLGVFIRNIHFILPLRIGFYYYKMICMLYDKIHKFSKC